MLQNTAKIQKVLAFSKFSALSSLLKIYYVLTLFAFLQYFAAFCSIPQHFLRKPWGINGDSENIHTKDTIPTQKPLLAITSAAQTLMSLLVPY